MQLRGRLSACVFAATLATAAAAEDETAMAADLQIAMQRHIDRAVIDGALLHLDPATGTLTPFYPTKAHPVILAGEGYFVLCGELADAAGRVVEVDYYLAPAGGGFRVFRTEIDNRAPLRQMMAAGLVERL